ncbi:protein of unknown function [Pseudomonas sp. JV551A1]|uniref:Uncharacterized protein n=1 Tax=Pseudomonas inefficax TaxID=2078786 RepID=A0AAQ1ST12_9PSED|nr:protein of unknown function [Pseudomonas sp. JV551A1]SPO60447.1 protein of unknown function [Pseudomonas inefficax]
MGLGEGLVQTWIAVYRETLGARYAPVGAGSPANTGRAGAMHRVHFFAGEPAPTGPRSGPGNLRVQPPISTPG